MISLYSYFLLKLDFRKRSIVEPVASTAVERLTYIPYPLIKDLNIVNSLLRRTKDIFTFKLGFH